MFVIVPLCPAFASFRLCQKQILQLPLLAPPLHQWNLHRNLQSNDNLLSILRQRYFACRHMLAPTTARFRTIFTRTQSGAQKTKFKLAETGMICWKSLLCWEYSRRSHLFLSLHFALLKTLRRFTKRSTCRVCMSEFLRTKQNKSHSNMDLLCDTRDKIFAFAWPIESLAPFCHKPKLVPISYCQTKNRRMCGATRWLRMSKEFSQWAQFALWSWLEMPEQVAKQPTDASTIRVAYFLTNSGQ